MSTALEFRIHFLESLFQFPYSIIVLFVKEFRNPTFHMKFGILILDVASSLSNPGLIKSSHPDCRIHSTGKDIQNPKSFIEYDLGFVGLD